MWGHLVILGLEAVKTPGWGTDNTREEMGFKEDLTYVGSKEEVLVQAQKPAFLGGSPWVNLSLQVALDSLKVLKTSTLVPWPWKQ